MSRTWLENTPNYDPRVVIYERKMFIRLSPGRFASAKSKVNFRGFLGIDLLPSSVNYLFGVT